MHKKISWDFWDTLITRQTLSSNDLFAILETTEKADGFKAARIRAETEASELYLQPTIDEIYTFLPNNFNKQQLKQQEVSLDILLATPIKENLEKLELTDYILSDYHIGANHLKKILETQKIDFKYENILVSSELSQNKRDGSSFKTLKKYKISKHVGDNYQADCLMAKKSKINGCWYKSSTQFTNTELGWRALSSVNQDKNSLCALLMGGVSRATRLQRPSDVSINQWNLFSDIIAPFSFAFLSWINEQTLKKDIEQLYFCARDGWLFYVMAKELKKHGILFKNVDIHYLYVSRKSQASGNFSKYLSKINMIENVKKNPAGSAIVDLGWSGSSQLTINKILKEKIGSPKYGNVESAKISGFYIYCDNKFNQKDVYSYLNEGFVPDQNFRRFCGVMESIFTSSEGSVIRYSDQDATPVLEPGNVNHEFTENSTTIFTIYTELLIKSFTIVNYTNSDLLKNTVVNLQRFLLTPTRQEASAFRNYRLFIKQDANGKYLIERLVNFILRPSKRRPLWKEGFLAHNGITWAYNLWKKK